MNSALKLQWRILSYFNRLIPLEEGKARVVEGNYSGRRPVLAGCRAAEQGARPSPITKGPAVDGGQGRQGLATRRGDGDGVADNGPHFQVFIFREIHRDHRSYQAVSFTLRSTSPAAMGLARSLPSRKSLTILSISREASGMRYDSPHRSHIKAGTFLITNTLSSTLVTYSVIPGSNLPRH